MHKYIIDDIWMSLQIASKNFLVLSLVLIFVYLFFGSSSDLNKNGLLIFFLFLLEIIVVIQSIYIYLVNKSYIVDLETGLITFPRSDIENSITAILLLYPYWNLMRSLTINANEIENLYIDTKRWSTKYKNSEGFSSKGKMKYKIETEKHVRYTINITGTFGSKNLQFLERQKRDEVRNAIEQCVKLFTGKNIDKKVSEWN
ncbi:hypothetical protein [Aliarcobacter cryaerophilus]|uniref:hypothetical protein n=1 Tax=Aliarcobacter cryaerophilus TaxID=28198 RepID=UPI0021B54F7D|nr:hypothetical protein [Aliarcobacter cryaerophilus]MCT7518983.1 hypothetical protein [Aliarcobacter cryaerophilus]